MNASHFTRADKETIDKIFEHDSEVLKAWKARLEEAQEKVKYWTLQVEAGSTLATRALIQKWADEVRNV